jgi:CheY-like chemotaxis protein
MSRLWILVVDDQEPVRDLIADILVAEGHYVRTVENGVDALRLLGEQEYDVILSDMMMPEMDGQQLYGEIASPLAAYRRPNGLPDRPGRGAEHCCPPGPVGDARGQEAIQCG